MWSQSLARYWFVSFSLSCDGDTAPGCERQMCLNIQCSDDTYKLRPNPKPAHIHSPSVCAFSWRVRHIKDRLKPSSAECNRTVKPWSSEPALVQAYGSPSRKCNRKMDEETTYKWRFCFSTLSSSLFYSQVCHADKSNHHISGNLDMLQ